MPISCQNDSNIFQKAACAVVGTSLVKKISSEVESYNPLNKIALNTLNNIPEIPKKQADSFIKNMLNIPSLKKSEFQIVNVTNKNTKEVINSLTQGFFKKVEKIFDFTKQKQTFLDIKNIYTKHVSTVFTILVESVKSGNNAYYYPINNVAITPKNKPILLAHEIGHAINANSSELNKKLITIARIFPKITTLTIPAIAIWQSFSNKDNKDKKFIQKHAGKLVFASFVPMLADEALASLRAIKAAKTNNLAKNIITGMKKGYGLAFSTYLVMACATSLLTTLATKLFSKKTDN